MRTVAIPPHRLPGDLTILTGPRGIVLFADGSGSSRLSPRNRAIADKMNAQGFATLLMDLLTPAEAGDWRNVFDIPLLVEVALWIASEPDIADLPLGLIGASTGVGAALLAGAEMQERISAVVSRGGRPDLAGPRLTDVRAHAPDRAQPQVAGGALLRETAENRPRRGASLRRARNAGTDDCTGRRVVSALPDAQAEVLAPPAAPVTRILIDMLRRELDYFRRDGDRFFDATQNARLVADAERYYRVMYYGAHHSWNLRDRHMFDTLQRLLALVGPDSKAVVWAHNSHIGDARFTDMGAERDALRHALSTRRLERYIGVIHRAETERWSHYSHPTLSDQYDAFAWFDETTAVIPPAHGGPVGRERNLSLRSVTRLRTASAKADPCRRDYPTDPISFAVFLGECSVPGERTCPINTPPVHGHLRPTGSAGLRTPLSRQPS